MAALKAIVLYALVDAAQAAASNIEVTVLQSEPNLDSSDKGGLPDPTLGPWTQDGPGHMSSPSMGDMGGLGGLLGQILDTVTSSAPAFAPRGGLTFMNMAQPSLELVMGDSGDDCGCSMGASSPFDDLADSVLGLPGLGGMFEEPEIEPDVMIIEDEEPFLLDDGPSMLSAGMPMLHHDDLEFGIFGQGAEPEFEPFHSSSILRGTSIFDDLKPHSTEDAPPPAGTMGPKTRRRPRKSDNRGSTDRRRKGSGSRKTSRQSRSRMSEL